MRRGRARGLRGGSLQGKAPLVGIFKKKTIRIYPCLSIESGSAGWEE